MSKDRFTASRYHLISAAQKRREALANMRESAIRCEECGTQVMPAELMAHMDSRCPGRPDPDRSCAWVTWSDAIGLGVKPHVLAQWARDGLVRAQGEKHERRYLFRDLVRWVARMRLEQRRIAAREQRMVRAQLEFWTSKTDRSVTP